MTRSTRSRNSQARKTEAPAKDRGTFASRTSRWPYLVAALGLGAVVVALVALRAGNSGDGSGIPLVEVVIPVLTVAEQEGETAFNARCASCHGDNAAGRDGTAPPLVHRIYEPGHHGDRAFFIAAQLGVRSHHWSFGDMPPVEDITEEEVTAIVTYVRALQCANGID